MPRYRIPPPCYPKCEIREPGCHGECTKYSDWRNECAKEKEVMSSYIRNNYPVWRVIDNNYHHIMTRKRRNYGITRED